jgi:two-component system, chemotaxis family, protein-glutamate methylesterase/glutaminase
MPKKIRVLVVDDSAVMRELLTEILNSDPDIEVVGGAADPYVAREKIKALNPDVLTLDVEMPRMDGLVFLSNLMRLRPMPVVMCASITQRGAHVILNALDLGAVDFVAKPTTNSAHGIRESAQEIISKVKVAAKAQVRATVDAARVPIEESQNADVVLPKRQPAIKPSAERIIAIGASTGGTEAIKEVLTRLSREMPPIVIVQHIPKAFSGAFAARMNAICEMAVCEATDGQPILPGNVYIAPGDMHLLVASSGGRYQCRLSDASPVNRHRPSVDVLFRSVAQVAARNSIGVILTGMGRDGAAGMKEMSDAGAATIAQDEASSVVWGMPGAAWDLGAAHSLHPLKAIAEKVITLAGTNPALLRRDNRSAQG